MKRAIQVRKKAPNKAEKMLFLSVTRLRHSAAVLATMNFFKKLVDIHFSNNLKLDNFEPKLTNEQKNLLAVNLSLSLFTFTSWCLSECVSSSQQDFVASCRTYLMVLSQASERTERSECELPIFYICPPFLLSFTNPLRKLSTSVRLAFSCSWSSLSSSHQVFFALSSLNQLHPLFCFFPFPLWGIRAQFPAASPLYSVSPPHAHTHIFELNMVTGYRMVGGRPLPLDIFIVLPSPLVENKNLF